MQGKLKKIVNKSDIGIYRLNAKSPLRIFIFSTEYTRRIVNDPAVCGVEYTANLQRGIELFLQSYQEHWSVKIVQNQTNVVHFLRGGLNFGIREALANTYGFNTHGCSYLSSQRDVDENGRWYIKKDTYEKVTVQKGGMIFLADVVATGITLDHGLQRLTEIIKRNKGSVRHLTFFTIGCHKTEKILEKYYKLWKKIFSDFKGIDIVYIEGKFHLADTKTPVNVKILGTDLLRRDSVLTPEFSESQNENITYPLERCVIYDAGSRAFNVPEYLEDIKTYWEQNLELAKNGMTTENLLKERYPEASSQLFASAKKIKLTRLCEAYLERIA